MKTLSPSRGKETKDHPPIYPVTHANVGQLSPPQWKIYELIVRRFMATLAEDALTENVLVEIDLNTQPFIARGQTYVKLGWKAFYPYSKAEDVELPPLEKGDRANLKDLKVLGKQTEPPGRYSQGSLISEMEKLGLGTKATRHEIIQKLYVRKYLTGQKAIEPTQLAFAVVEAFDHHAPKVVQPVLTKDLENEMDEVAAGKKKKADVVADARVFLEESLVQLQAHKAEVRIELKKGLRGDSVIGVCKKCGQELLIRYGKTGKRFVGCSGYPQCSNSFPLPQKGTLAPMGKDCPICQHPLIEVKTGKGRPWQMCLNMSCASKDEWRARQAEKEARSAGEPKPTLSSPSNPQNQTAPIAAQPTPTTKMTKPQKTFVSKKIKK
jgi:DNA topoisomerase-1